MKFNPDKIGLGRHESFPLRYSWLTRGFSEFVQNPKIFDEEDAITRLGVGKNMVKSIRFWLKACRVLRAKKRQDLEKTELGNAIFSDDGWDPYLEDNATLWLIHWLLSTNPEEATANYWFFNRFHKTTYVSKEPQSAFVDFCQEQVAARFAATTARKDIAVLLRMYSRTQARGKVPPEESLDSPLSTLGLLTYSSNTRAYISVPDNRNEIPTAIIGFAVSELLDELEITNILVESLMYTRDRHPVLGAIFRLTENGLIAHLERLVEAYSSNWELRESAGLSQLYRIDRREPMEFLRDYYAIIEESVEEAA